METAQTTLPPGIWFEEERQRYRIRLYLNRRVVFRAYRSSKEEALIALALGKQKREAARTRPAICFDISSPAALLCTALAASRG